jgi:hypothetical protein
VGRTEPIRKRQTAFGGTGQGYIDQFPQLFSAEDRWPPAWVGNFFKSGESVLIEATHPIIGNGEMATDALGYVQQSIALTRQVNDAEALMDAGGQRQITNLGTRRG